MPRHTLRHGLRHVGRLAVVEALTVPALSPALGAFAKMPPVFATALLVGFVEATCIEALQPHLAPGEDTVGTHIAMSHRAATPVGMTVTANVELVEVNVRRLRFRVVCRDEVEVIGEGDHERFIVDTERFLASVEHKRIANSLQERPARAAGGTHG